MNTLFFGDNLHILREHIPAESVDLIYLDPPFNSKRAYNVYLSTPKGHQSDAQITAFEDTWHWGDQAEQEYSDLLRQSNTDMAELITSLRRFLKESDMMAYLIMMATRLLEMHKVLKPTGSLYLHCDPTASHYLKIVLDMVFGALNFQNEIVWKRASAHNDPNRYGNIHDIIFFYSKTKNYTWNAQYTPYSQEYLDAEWRKLPSGRMYKFENMLDPQNRMEEFDFMGTIARWRTNRQGMMDLWNAEQTEVPDSHGRIKLGKDGLPIKRCRIIFLDEMKGVPLQTWWDDIVSLRGGSTERLGYPTQKPLALLERIIQTSSNPGDTVLDPFCGCGTAVHAAQKLGRNWLGIDITHLAIHLIERRMKEAFPGIQFKIHGEPEDLDAARDLALRDKYEFQFWACSLVGAQPYKSGKKGADGGIDGLIYFQDDKTTTKKIIVSVKGGDSVTRTMIADLKNTVENEHAQIGLFVTLSEPTEPMRKEAIKAGYYTNPFGEQFPKIQILTIEELLKEGKKPQYRDFTGGNVSFKKAKAEKQTGEQPALFGQE